jgi:hypothetical protein
MKFFGWKRAISFVFAALATLEIAAAPAQNVQTVTVAPGQSVTINSKGEVQKQGTPQGQAQGQPAAQPQGQSQAQPQGQKGGQAFSQQQLDELLAPIALYPDALLGQVLAASKNPQEVIDAGNWMGLKENQGLKDDALDQAAKKAGFSPPMQALLHFPDVVDMMASQMDWVRQLGEAMNTDQKAVLNSVQRLRDQAVDVGSLKSNDKQTVDVKQEGNTTVVVVQPANPQVIYVPQYDPQKVYAPPPQPTPTPEKEEEGVSTETAVMASLLSFGVGMAVGSAVWGGGCCYPSWGYGGVYYGRAVYVAPAYRPAYGGGWGYSNAYHRSGYYANNQNRLTVNNNNYYNRFDGNQNRRAGYQPSNYVRPTDPNGLTAKREEFRNNANANAANRNPGARATPAGGTNRQVPSREDAQAAAQGKLNEKRAAAGTSGGTPSGDRAANAQAQRQSAGGTTGGTPSGDRLANAQSQRAAAGGSTGGTTPSGDRLANAQSQRAAAGGSTGGTSPSGGNAASRMPASDRPSTPTPSGDRGFDQGQRSSGSGAFGGSGSSGRAASASSSRGRSSMRGGGGRRGR